MTFADATQVRAAGDGRYDTVVHDGWDIGGNANGGYLLALAVRAMLDASGRDDPVTITAHYLRPGHPGPATVATEVVKAGKAFATVRGTLSNAEGQPMLAVLGTFGTLRGPGEDAERVTAAPPDLPPFDECGRVDPTDGFPPPFMGNVDLRLHPADAFATGVRSGEAIMRGWFTFPELGVDGSLDPIGLIQATDAFPPTIFNTDLPVAWVPTVELTAHVRARPAPGPLRCVFTTRFVTGGFLEEDDEVWDSTGRLVAQSRQLALLPRG